MPKLFKDIDPELRKKYKNTFTSGDGIVVFAHMLSEQGFLSMNVADAGEVELRNYAVRLLGIVGLDEPTGQDIFIETLARNLTSVSEKKPEQETRKIGIDDSSSPFRGKK